LIRIIFILLFSFSALFSQTNLIISKNGDTFSDFKVEMYEDSTASLSFLEIKEIKEFIPQSNSISTGYSNSNFWFRFNIRNASNSDLNYFIQFSENFAHEIDCYIISSNGKYSKSELGVGRFSNNSINKHIKSKFKINLERGESKTVYLRLFGKYPNYTSFNILNQETLNKYTANYDRLYSFYFGAIFSLLLYNLFIYIFSRDRSYLYYVLYVSAFLSWQMQLNGFFPFDTYSSTSSYYFSGISTPLFIAFFMFFSRTILDTKLLSPRIDKVILYMGYFYIVLAFSSIFYLHYSYVVINGLASLLIPSLLFIGIKSYLSGNKTALFYIVAQIAFLMTSTFFSLMTDGFLEYNLFTRHGIVIGAFVEIVLFSLALAYRIKLLHNEKIELTNKVNLELEEKIKQRTKELEGKNKTFEHLLDNTIEAIALFQDLKCVDINEEGIRLFKFKDKNDALGKSVLEFVAPDSVEKGKEMLLLNRTKAYEVNGIKQDGEIFPIYIKGRFIEIDGINTRITSCIDLTALKEKENALQIEKVRAEESTKLKSEFLANMSHEIRTPMNGIIGMTYLALQTDLNDKQKHYLQTINSSSNSLLNIINDILDFSKIEAGKLEIDMHNFNLIDIMKNIKNSMEFKANEKALVFEINYEEDIETKLYGDGLRISQILINLISNAIKFTSSGFVKVDIKSIGTRYIFEVKDSGLGISEEKLSQLFESFSQADGSITREYGGTGLGLAISKQLLELMDGEIFVTSVVDEGSIFRVELNIDKSKNTIINDEIKKYTIEDIKTIAQAKILLVEDNSINQEILIALLEGSSIVVDIANNGEEGVQMFKNNKYELILMDLQMPIMDGYEATKIIRELNSDIPIIALTANAMKEDIQRTKKVMMDEHLNKPIDVQKLYKTLLKYITPKNISQNLNTDETSVEKAEIIIPKFNHINVSIGLNHLANNHKLYKKILKDFYYKYNNLDLEKLDNEIFMITVHTIKGLSASLGIVSLNLIAIDLEKSLDEMLLSKFYDELGLVLKELKLMIESDKNENIEKEKIPDFEKRELFIQLKEAINTSRPVNCERIIKKLNRIKLDSSDDELFNSVKVLIEKYKFKDALEVIKSKL